MKKHLTYLIGEYLARKRDGFPRATKYNGSLHYKYRERWDKGNYHYRQKKPRLYKGQLKHYRVVINDVLVRGEKFVNAKNFMDKEKQNERERIKA